MSGIVPGVVAHLQSLGFVKVYADRRWHDPEPGGSVIVVTELDTWSRARHSGEFPAVRVSIFSAPNDGQDDAENVGSDLARQLRNALHVPHNLNTTWGGERVLSSTHAGSGLDEVEGQPAWRVRTLVFELTTG